MPLDRSSAARAARRAWARTRDLLSRLYRALGEDHVTLVAAGVAFYSFLAIVPALAALVSVYGLAFDADDVVAQMSMLREIAPREVVALLSEEAERLTAVDRSSLGLGVLGGAIVATWSATKGARALISALNIIFRDREQRGIVQIYWLSVVFTLVGLLVMTFALFVLVTLPAIVQWLPPALHGIAGLARGALVFFGFLLAIGAIYRFGPCTRNHRWITAGAFVAAVLWLVASWLMHLFVRHVASFNASFGSVSTVAVFLLWLYLSALCLLVGAEIDDVRATAKARPA